MTPPPAPTTVWIVDDDLGFVWWLGEVFTEAGCRALPALSCEQAISLLNILNVGADLLVVNPRLPGVSGMVQVLIRINRNLKIVAIGRAPTAVSAAIRPHATMERPSGSGSISHSDWLKKVRKLLKEVEAPATV